jgi:hypothetical protein
MLPNVLEDRKMFVQNIQMMAECQAEEVYYFRRGHIF